MKIDKKRLTKGAAYLLLLIVFVTSIFGAIPKELVEPENPLVTKTEELKVDIRTTSGAASTEQSDIELESQTMSEEDSKESSDDHTPEEPEEPETPPEDPPEEENEDEPSEEISEELEPEKDEGEGASEEISGENGETDPNLPGNNESGETPNENGDEIQNTPGTGEEPGEDEHGLVTDLKSGIILFSQLNEDTLRFYAYYSDSSIDANIKVNYKHKSDTGNGTWLSVSGTHNYQTKLKLGTNYITIYYTDGDGERNWARIVITYQADKADAAAPTVGAHPPIISTNLDSWTGEITTSSFMLTVDAKTWENKRIHADHVQVWMDGKEIKNPTGSGILEYLLYFERPLDGDYEDHSVAILAWDEEGNSKYVEYTITYHAHDEGLDIGQVRVLIDATTVSCGVIDDEYVDVKSGDTAADAIVSMLEACGYSYDYSGSIDGDFYLQRLTRANAFDGCEVEARLKELLERDGITLWAQTGTRDSLGQFDFTRVSGWMYFINGDYAPGVALSKWSLQGGETISLRFTVAGGKDLGSPNDSEGSLSNYCAKWVNGEVIEQGHNYEETARVEPDELTDGYIETTCSRCGDVKVEVLPATGEEEVPNTPEEPEVPEEPETPEPEGPSEDSDQLQDSEPSSEEITE